MVFPSDLPPFTGVCVSALSYGFLPHATSFVDSYGSPPASVPFVVSKSTRLLYCVWFGCRRVTRLCSPFSCTAGCSLGRFQLFVFVHSAPASLYSTPESSAHRVRPSSFSSSELHLLLSHSSLSTHCHTFLPGLAILLPLWPATFLFPLWLAIFLFPLSYI